MRGEFFFLPRNRELYAYATNRRYVPYPHALPRVELILRSAVRRVLLFYRSTQGCGGFTRVVPHSSSTPFVMIGTKLRDKIRIRSFWAELCGQKSAYGALLLDILWDK